MKTITFMYEAPIAQSGELLTANLMATSGPWFDPHLAVLPKVRIYAEISIKRDICGK